MTMSPSRLLALQTTLVVTLVLPTTVVAASKMMPICPTRDNWQDDPEACPCEVEWQPSDTAIRQIISEHRTWLDLPSEAIDQDPPLQPKRAVLCNAYLHRIDLREVKLQEADLRGVVFNRVALQNTNFHGADLQEADFRGEAMLEVVFDQSNLQGANFREAEITDSSFLEVEGQAANFKEAALTKVDFKGAILNDSHFEKSTHTETRFDDASLFSSHLDDAVVDKGRFRNADLREADLRGVHMTEPDFRGAMLLKVDWRRAQVSEADFSKTKLHFVFFRNMTLVAANFRGADLRGAEFVETDLNHSHLENADLREAQVLNSVVENVSLAGAKVSGLRYEAIAQPNENSIAGIEGLDRVYFKEGRHGALAQLRELMRKNHYREMEREITYSIRQNQARFLRESEQWTDRLHGVAQLVFFEWTVDWGLRPGKALRILLMLLGCSFLLYTAFVWRWSSARITNHFIYRVPPRDSEALGHVLGGPPENAGTRLQAGLVRAALWGAYFSILSAFHIGWRDLNVGAWLTQLQFSDFGLRGTGVVRLWSGLQAVVSVFLLALWILTYFGRPF